MYIQHFEITIIETFKIICDIYVDTKIWTRIKTKLLEDVNR